MPKKIQFITSSD